MKVFFLPVYRMGVSFTISYGRRWSLLEHMLLAELLTQDRSVAALADRASLPNRLIVEALINLLRAGWVEVRSTDEGINFALTSTGKQRAMEDELPAQLSTSIKTAQLCMDRVTGSWMRYEDLDLVYDRDLPDDAQILSPVLHTYEARDAALRDLIRLSPEEMLEPIEPVFRTPSRPYARISVKYGQIEGVPDYASLRLKQAINEYAETVKELPDSGDISLTASPAMQTLDTINESDLVVGGEAHLEFLVDVLKRAKSHVIIHSCFLNSKTITQLLPHLMAAANRKVRVDLLWGLHFDQEDEAARKPITEVQAILDKLPEPAKSRIVLSPMSSGSHAKVLIFDDPKTGAWAVLLGSCNFLSTAFKALEVSVRIDSQGFVKKILSHLVAGQLPASGEWTQTASRLHKIWTSVHREQNSRPEQGSHQLTLLVDHDHYACVTTARDRATHKIVIGSDLFGIAAETSVLVPMQRAIEMGRDVQLFYHRPSRFLTNDGHTPEEMVKSQGRTLALQKISELHGKFLLWDDAELAISSFNWLATVAADTRARGAELGVLISGSNLGPMISRALSKASSDAISLE